MSGPAILVLAAVGAVALAWALAALDGHFK